MLLKPIKRHIIFIINLCFIHGVFVAFLNAQNSSQVTLLTTKTTFKAGTNIVLQFNTNTPASLYCHSAYGSTVVQSNTNEQGSFTLPAFLASKKGVIDYTLFANGSSLHKGHISVIASDVSYKSLESYIGPPSISAGGNDYTMLVVIPTDTFDNPVASQTPVAMKHQFLNNQVITTEKTTNFIAWKNIYSYPVSGRMLVASSTNKVQSQEFSIEVFPAQPTNFTIGYERKHSYADGNQITTFSTSVIKDKYNNSISDGTLVDFVIKNNKGMVLKAQGSSINGVASSKMLHPDHPNTWQVTAYVSGMAVSNTITLNYTAATTKLPIAFAEKNRSITVGPLQSFMGQLIPDGAIVKLLIYTNNRLLETKQQTTRKGNAIFTLEQGFYASGTYSFTIQALGLEKNYQNIKL